MTDISLRAVHVRFANTYVFKIIDVDKHIVLAGLALTMKTSLVPLDQPRNGYDNMVCE